MALPTWLDKLSGQVLRIAGVTKSPSSKIWNFVSGVTAVYNAGTGAWDLTVASGGGSGDVVGPGGATSGNLPQFSSGTGKALSDSGISAAAVELARRPLSSYTAASNDAALADARKCIITTRATAITLRIRLQSATVWLTESLLGGINTGAGTLTITAEAGVTLNGTVTVVQNGWWWAKRTASDTWQVFTGGSVAADGTTLTLSAGTLSISAGGVGTAQLAADAVTYPKIQNVSAASRVLGRGSASGAGDVEELAFTGGVTISGTNVQLSAALLPIATPGTAFQSLRWNAGATALESYTPGAGLTGPANPADDNKLAIALAGNLTYALLANANVSASAAIAYSKLASGTSGRWLTINASGVVIESDTALGSKTIQHSAADALGATLTLFATRGTSASPTANNASDILGGLVAQGHDGSAAFNGGSIKFRSIFVASTSKGTQAESTIHDGTAEVTTGTFKRFPRTTTTDATLTTLNSTMASVAVAADSTVKLSIIWHGQQSSNMAHRETSLTVRRSGSGNVVEVSHSDSVALFKDDGSWGDETQIAYVLNNTSHAVDFTVQGKAATTVVWTGEVAWTVYS